MRKRNVQILFRLTEEEAEQRRLYEEEQELSLNLEGEDMGILIGKRG